MEVNVFVSAFPICLFLAGRVRARRGEPEFVVFAVISAQGGVEILSHSPPSDLVDFSEAGKRSPRLEPDSLFRSRQIA